MTSPSRETSDILKLFRMLAVDKELAPLAIQLTRVEAHFWEREGATIPMWRMVVSLPRENSAPTVVYLNNFAIEHRLQIELEDRQVILTFKRLGTG